MSQIVCIRSEIMGLFLTQSIASKIHIFFIWDILARGGGAASKAHICMQIAGKCNFIAVIEDRYLEREVLA